MDYQNVQESKKKIYKKALESVLLLQCSLLPDYSFLMIPEFNPEEGLAKQLISMVVGTDAKQRGASWFESGRGLSKLILNVLAHHTTFCILQSDHVFD